MLYVELAIVFALVIVNGLLSMSELAIVSARQARLKALAERGVRGSRRALALAADPGRFLSTVQIGITLIGIASGAFSGATLGLRLTDWLQQWGIPNGLADALGVGIVVTLITYFSLIIGELVPKQLALRDPERVAVRVSPAMTLLAKIAGPVVWVLDISGRGVLRLMRQQTPGEGQVTEEEVRTIIAEAETAGVIEPDERKLIAGVMRLGDRPVRGIMTPRTEVDWIEVHASEERLREILLKTPHSRLPVADGAVDATIGVVHTRDLLAAALVGAPLDITRFIRPAPVVHDNFGALDVMAVLQSADVPMALVHDEYGHFEGLVTPSDLLETIAGVFKADTDEPDPSAVQRADGSWLIAGYMPADEMSELLRIPLPEQRGYETVAGFILSRFQRLPATGDAINVRGWRFEVVDLDGRRIDKLLVSRLPATRRDSRIAAGAKP